MKITIITLGSRGDVQPYVALGRGLQAHGHSVTLCTAERFRDFIVDHGLNYGYMGDNILALADNQEVRKLMGETTNLFGALRTMVKMAGQVGPLQRQMVEDTWAAVEAADPDLIIFHPKTYTGTHFAEKLGIPAILAPTVPQFVATSELAPIGFPELPLGGWYNRMGYDMVVRMMGLGVGGYTNEWRKAHGLETQMRGTDFVRKQAGEPIPVLHPVSKHVYPVPSDWPDNVHTTGYWFLDEQTDWTPPEALENFLAAGEPPVYVGFGSMVSTDPRQMTETVIRGLQQAGVRGVLASGWGGLDADDLPASIFKLEQAPHSWLFPRMRAVVHHGGAGTTAAGLRAGKPTLICPYFGDQPFWGQRIYELGVGPTPLPQKQLTAEGLAAAIHTITTDDAMHRNASQVGEKIRAEDGVSNAIAAIEAYMGVGAEKMPV